MLYLSLLIRSCVAALKVSPYFIIVYFWSFGLSELVLACFESTVVLKDLLVGVSSVVSEPRHEKTCL